MTQDEQDCIIIEFFEKIHGRSGSVLTHSKAKEPTENQQQNLIKASDSARGDPLAKRSDAYSVPNGAVVKFHGGYADAAGDRWLESLG